MVAPTTDVLEVVADNIGTEADVAAGKTVTFTGSAVTLVLHPVVATGNSEIWRLRDADVTDDTDNNEDAATLVDVAVACLKGCACLASTVTTFSRASAFVLGAVKLPFAICCNSFSNVETFGSLPCLCIGWPWCTCLCVMACKFGAVVLLELSCCVVLLESSCCFGMLHVDCDDDLSRWRLTWLSMFTRAVASATALSFRINGSPNDALLSSDCETTGIVAVTALNPVHSRSLLLAAATRCLHVVLARLGGGSMATFEHFLLIVFKPYSLALFTRCKGRCSAKGTSWAIAVFSTATLLWSSFTAAESRRISALVALFGSFASVPEIRWLHKVCGGFSIPKRT